MNLVPRVPINDFRVGKRSCEGSTPDEDCHYIIGKSRPASPRLVVLVLPRTKQLILDAQAGSRLRTLYTLVTGVIGGIPLFVPASWVSSTILNAPHLSDDSKAWLAILNSPPCRIPGRSAPP